MISGFAALMSVGIFTAILVLILVIWTITWKGIALWIAAQENNKPWFIALLVLNTAGIVEIVYIFLFSDWGKKYITHHKNKRTEKKKHKAAHKHQSESKEKEDSN
jgi:uncharacterized membrane protein